MSDRIPGILKRLQHKAVLKQSVYRTTLEVFDEMRDCASEIIDALAPEFRDNDNGVEIMLNDYGTFEFHMKFSGDTLVFIMHTNVFTFPPNHPVSKSDYLRKKPEMGYFGMIQIYNFLSDSIRYNRLADEGYQLSRIFINEERHFCTEGKRKLGFLFSDVSKFSINREHVRTIIEECMLYCLDFDLYVPPGKLFDMITVEQKNYFNNPSGISTGKRLGFTVVDQTKVKH
ncbi:MAG: hypothetical protein GC181_11070 [Bacteroidetes bacterium]|nr:hypothetical protein [Bacteroidota bacterium]